MEVTSIERHQVIAAACSEPSEYGLERTTWSHESLTEALEGSGLVRSISSSTVGRILAEAENKPHRVKSWCHSTDPQYQPKMRAIVDLYVSPPAGEPVLSIDEKSGIQVLSRLRSLVPASPGRRPATSSSTGGMGRGVCFGSSTFARARSWDAARSGVPVRTSSPSWTSWPSTTASAGYTSYSIT